MEIKIIKIKKEDQKEAGKFCQTIYEEMGWNKKFMYGFEDLGKTFGSSGEVFFLAKNAGKIIGCVGLKKLNRETSLMKRFYVDKEYRGAGLAGLLFRKILKFSKAKEYQSIVLDTYQNNFRAQKFYLKCGFREFSPEPQDKWPESQAPQLFKYFKLDL